MRKWKRRKLDLPGAIGALLLLVVSLVCGWAMFAVSGMENYEPLLKTVRYSLNWEMGMGFYDKPGGTEQMVMYPEDGADPSLVPEKKEGERWLDTGKLKVDKPSDGWAKVDIGDDGEPLYVEEQYVISKEGAMFEGRQGENTFLTVGAKNLPPSGWIKLLGFLVYFSLYFPLFAIFRWGFDTEEHTRRVMKHVSWIVYAGLAYFIILYTLKFVCGYNVDRYWFVSATVLGNTFYSIANMVLGIIGCLAMVFFVWIWYMNSVASTLSGLLRNVGWRGFFLLIFAAYFLWMFLGVAIMLASIILIVYLIIIIVPAVMADIAGNSGSRSKSDAPLYNCCASCARYDGSGHCYEGREVHDPLVQCCRKYHRNV